MNDGMASLCIILFLALPPALLVLKVTTNRTGWGISLGVILLLGWGLLFGTYTFRQLNIEDLIAQNKELPDGWDSDGASGLFALYFGWLLSLAYFTLWLATYFFATLIRRLLRLRHAPNKRMQLGAAEPRH
jgi:uncharacterized membrane protein (DUF485 family)